MKKIFQLFDFNKDKEKTLRSLTVKKIRENKEVLDSLEKYDKGEKEISTDGIKRHMSGV